MQILGVLGVVSMVQDIDSIWTHFGLLFKILKGYWPQIWAPLSNIPAKIQKNSIVPVMMEMND